MQLSRRVGGVFGVFTRGISILINAYLANSCGNQQIPFLNIVTSLVRTKQTTGDEGERSSTYSLYQVTLHRKKCWRFFSKT
jgi:hypothetical protein